MFLVNYIFFFVFLLFLGPLPWHMGVPRLGVKLELQLPAYHHSQTQQSRIQATSATYIIAHSNAGSPTQGARPGIEPASSRILVGFVSAEPG